MSQSTTRKMKMVNEKEVNNRYIPTRQWSMCSMYVHSCKSVTELFRACPSCLSTSSVFLSHLSKLQDGESVLPEADGIY